MRRYVLIGVAIPFLFILGCATASTSSADTYLIRTLDDQAKAKALTDEGIEKYQLWLVQREDYTKIGEVRQCFTFALSYDPDNVLATQYRNLVDNFKTTRLRQTTKDAASLMAKPKRKEDEDLKMCLAVQAAVRLDPANPTVVKLAKDTSQVKDRLVATYQTRIKASLDKIASGGTQEILEPLYIDAYQTASKAMLIDPQNTSLANMKKSLSGELGKIFTRHADTVNKLIAAWKFDNAKTEINFLSDLNKKLAGAYDAKVRAAVYSLNFQWARSFFGKKEYFQADAKLNAALSISKSDEALALKKKIADISRQAQAEASFESALSEVDALISSGQLAVANDKINAMDDSATEKAKQDILENRRSTVRAKLKDIYAGAVDDYRKENFKDAIEKLQMIVQIDVGYEQAADYLDKAKAKQKLIDEY
jgi:hypothetical protein